MRGSSVLLLLRLKLATLNKNTINKYHMLYNHYRTFHYYVYKEQQRTKNDFNTKIDIAQNTKIDIAQH